MKDCSDDFDEMLDVCYPNVIICGITFTASQILKNNDPVAYNCLLGDYESEYPSDDENDI